MSSPPQDPPVGPNPGSDLPQEAARALTEAMRDQKKRQERLRHVQEFLTSPTFIDMKDQPIRVSDSPAEIAERRRDLSYRINVLESVLAMLIEELDLMDRIETAAAEPPPEATAETS